MNAGSDRSASAASSSLLSLLLSLSLSPVFSSFSFSFFSFSFFSFSFFSLSFFSFSFFSLSFFSLSSFSFSPCCFTASTSRHRRSIFRFFVPMDARTLFARRSAVLGSRGSATMLREASAGNPTLPCAANSCFFLRRCSRRNSTWRHSVSSGAGTGSRSCPSPASCS